MKFIEARLQSFIELLEYEDFPHFLGNAVTRLGDEVLIEADLKGYLLTQYKKAKLGERSLINHSAT